VGAKFGEKGRILIFGFWRWGSIAANNTTTNLDDLDVKIVQGFYVYDIVGPRASGGDVLVYDFASGN